MKIQKAIEFSALKHSGQKRKKSDIPYIAHLMEVMYIMLRDNCSDEVIVAGLLHDAIEDTNTTADEIRESFGENVLKLVMSNTENKALSWKERKQNTINSIKNLTQEQMQVLCADKLANLSSTAREIEIDGDEVWNKFNASKEESLWYYAGVVNQLNEYMQPNNMLKELSSLCSKFVDYTAF